MSEEGILGPANSGLQKIGDYVPSSELRQLDGKLEIPWMKSRIAGLEAENDILKRELEISKETVDALIDSMDTSKERVPVVFDNDYPPGLTIWDVLMVVLVVAGIIVFAFFFNFSEIPEVGGSGFAPSMEESTLQRYMQKMTGRDK